jgi:hypothetical protein
VKKTLIISVETFSLTLILGREGGPHMIIAGAKKSGVPVIVSLLVCSYPPAYQLHVLFTFHNIL